METVLLDTNIISYFVKQDTRAQLYAGHIRGRRLAISFMTVAELYQWAIRRTWGPNRVRELQDALRHYVVLPYDEPLAWAWARVSSLKGYPVAPGDAWIAATALRHSLPLITHNRTHFERIPNLTLISEG